MAGEPNFPSLFASVKGGRTKTTTSASVVDQMDNKVSNARGYVLFSARLGMKKSSLFRLHFFAMYLQ